MISQSKIGDKRDRILLAARRLFVRQGFHATPTSAIAKEAGVANGTLFHYFKTKEELIYVLYRETCERYYSISTYGVDKEKTIKRKFRVLWYNTVRWGLNRPQEFLFMQQFMHSPFFPHLSREGMPAYIRFSHALINQGKENGILKDIPTDLMSQLSLYQHFAVINFLLQHDELQQNIGYLNTAFEFYWDSFGKYN